MSHEIELKLDVRPEAAERLMRKSWLHRAQCKSAHQVSTYYDTPDQKLRKRGYTLRVRSANGRFIQTVKSLDRGAGLFERGEWEYETQGPGPDAEKLLSTPLAGLEVDGLEPLITSDVKRTAFRLKPNGAEIEVDFDQGRLSAGGVDREISEIEIELLRGDPASAIKLARRISSQVPVKLGVMSKAERGFALARGALGRVSKAEAVTIDAGMTVGEGFAAIVNACIRHFRLNEEIISERRKPEALHQSRVAMRRLRAALSLFRTAIADEEFLHIRGELKWFTALLGDARNLDVYLERDLPERERRPLRKRREAAYDRVIEAIDSSRCRRLMLDLVAWAALGKWRGSAAAGGPLQPYVTRRIDRLWRKLHSARHVDHMSDEQRHRLRILIKKLRYALEFAQALHVSEGPRQRLFAEAVEKLQEELGSLNDAAVARAMGEAGAWLVEPAGLSEAEEFSLDEADLALKQLRRIGPYWRAAA